MNKHRVEMTLTVKHYYVYEVEASSVEEARRLVDRNWIPNPDGIVDLNFKPRRCPFLGVEDAVYDDYHILGHEVTSVSAIPQDEEEDN